MILLLNNGRKYSVKELADTLEVSPRMIRSYKNDLELAGIYVDTIRGPYGGYVLNRNVRVPKRKFKHKDFLLLKKVINKLDDENLTSELIVLADKVQGIYQGSKAETTELNIDDNMKSKYNAISRAIKEHYKVKILYYSYNKGENERIIHPHDMFLFGNGWGTAAYCEAKKDLRHFELKRIREYTILEEKF